MASTGSSSNPYKFAATSGYRDDGDCGLSHVGARYYDAQVGRFVTRDTYLDQHPYLYCEHDPVNSVDPSGHNRLTEWIGNQLGMDFNLTKEEWNQVWRQAEQNGKEEMLWGGLGTGSGTFVQIDPRQSVPGFPMKKFPYQFPGNSGPIPTGQWAKPMGVVKVIGAGLAIGGTITVIISKIGQYCTN